MRWQQGRRSENVEDRRGMPSGRVMAGGGLGMLILVVVITLLGGDPRGLLQQAGNQPPAVNQPVDGAQDELKEFVQAVLADTEDVWTALFRQQGRQYRNPKLVLFNGSIDSACGYASAAVGPFYCPLDQKVYLDLSFFNDLETRFKSPGDFAQAYVIAHEIGHHVQNQLGISEKVQQARGRVSEEEYNQLSVRLELQADFFAGVWANHAQRMKNLLEPGDIEEGLRAASAIGDDKIQMQSRGYVVPDSFTHGSSEQRMRWFRRGLQTGDMTQGDTFSAREL